MIICPKCGTKAVEWDKELTITGPIASLKCGSCAWTSVKIVDGRKRLTPPVNVQFEGNDLDTIAVFKAGGGTESDIADLVGSFLNGKVFVRA